MLLLAELHVIIDVVGLRSAILLFSICLTPFFGSFKLPAFFCFNQNFLSCIFLTFLVVFSSVSLLYFFSVYSQDYSIHLGLITIYFNIESLLVKYRSPTTVQFDLPPLPRHVAVAMRLCLFH